MTIIAAFNLGRAGVGQKAKYGLKATIATTYGVDPRTVSRLVAAWDEQITAGVLVPDLRSKKKGNTGVGNLKLTDELCDCIFEFASELKGDFTYESFAQKFNEDYEMEPPVSKTTMWRWFQRLDVVEKFSFVKPLLKPKHLQRRLEFVLDKLEPYNATHFRVKDQTLHLHLDEKWFYVVREKRRLKLLPGMLHITQAVRHKSHIKKVMFIAVVGMPHDRDNISFDGKIGMFPLVHMVPAKKNSVHRPAGTLEAKGYNLTSETYLDIMTREGGILDTIKEKMPWAKNDNIVIQHDGAPGHNGKGNSVFLAQAGMQDGWNITIDTQPAQSPDTNLCDLCFFNSLQSQSFQIRSQCTTEAELVQTVMQAWDNYSSDKLERAWGHLFACYREILKDKGGNRYEKPHSNVCKRQRADEQTIDELVPIDLVLTGREALDAMLNA